MINTFKKVHLPFSVCDLTTPLFCQTVSPVDVPEHDLVTQWHPKEEDLVFLTVTEKRSPSLEEKENCDVCYVGLVTKFKSGNTSSKFGKQIATRQEQIPYLGSLGLRRKQPEL